MTLPAAISPTQSIVASQLPDFGDSKKNLYISYRVSGFSPKEAVQMTKIGLKTIYRWREKDPKFKEYDTERIAEITRTMGTKFAATEFLRNFRLVLEKDMQVFKRAVEGRNLNDQDYQYLIKARSNYTPQQLQAVEHLLKGEEMSDLSKVNLGQLAMLVGQVNITNVQQVVEPAKPIIEGEVVEAT